jgi:hypothetical protein
MELSEVQVIAVDPSDSACVIVRYLEGPLVGQIRSVPKTKVETVDDDLDVPGAAIAHVLDVQDIALTPPAPTAFCGVDPAVCEIARGIRTEQTCDLVVECRAALKTAQCDLPCSEDPCAGPDCDR